MAALLPFGGEWSCWVLHAGQASPAGRREGASLPPARLMVPCVLCSHKGQMARLVGTVWVTAVLGAGRSTEGNGHQSHCYSKVWAPQRLPRHECLSCWRSVTPAQMSPMHLQWQHDPRLVQLIRVLLSWGVSPLCPRRAGSRSWEHHCCWCPVLPASLRPSWRRGVSMAFRVLRGQVSLRRALGGATGN